MSEVLTLFIIFLIAMAAQSLIITFVHLPIYGAQVRAYVVDTRGRQELLIIAVGSLYGAFWITLWAFLCRFIGIDIVVFWGVVILGQLVWVGRSWIYAAGVRMRMNYQARQTEMKETADT